MARHRSKLQKPRGKPRGIGGHGTWQSPREQFVYGPEVTLADLSREWEGLKGCSHDWLIKKARSGKWKKWREEYQARNLQETERKFLEKDSDRRTRILEKATERHMEVGRKYLDTADDYRMAGHVRLFGKFKCPHCGGAVPVPKDEVKATDAFRAAIQGMIKGVEVERKALGIADRVELDYRFTEMSREVIQVIEMFVTDVDVMENIVYKLQQIGKKDREELARITSSGDIEK